MSSRITPPAPVGPPHAQVAITARRYSPAPDFRPNGVGLAAMTASFTFYEPFIVTSPITVTDVAFEVTTFQTGLARIGLCRGGNDLQPVAGSLLLDTGVAAEYDVSTNGIKQTNNLSIPLSPGLYLKMIRSTGAPTARYTHGGPTFGFDTTAFSTWIYQYRTSEAYAAFTSTPTAIGGALVVGNEGPRHYVFMRWT